MSFINSITGNIPHSELIITESNISADNASFTNISAVNASFINLSTTTFTPININSSLINVSNANVSNGNISILNISLANVSDLIINELELINLSVDNISNDTIDTEVINIKSNNQLLPNGQLRKLNNDVLFNLGNPTDLGTFSLKPDGVTTKLNFNNGLLTINNSIHTSYIHVSNMSLDGTLGGNTLNVVNVNSNYVNVNNISNDYINTNTIVCDVLGAFQAFSSTTGSIATLNGNTATYNTGVISDINSSTLVVSDTSLLTDLEVLGTADINTLNVIGANGLTSTKILCNNINGTLINVSTINNSTSNSKTSNISTLNVSNISSSNISTIFNITCNNLKGNIRDNIQAGPGISLVTASNITTITNTGLVTSPLNVSVINSSFITTKTMNSSTDNVSILNASTGNIITTNTSKINVSNISCNDEISANFLNAIVSIGAPVISSADFIGSQGSFATLNGTTTNTSTLNASNIAVYDTITALDIVASGGFYGDISNNLLAGNNITLSTTGGITTISSTAGGVTDPLNLSTLNASQINASNISVGDELSANYLNAIVSIGAPVISSADFIGSQGSFATLNGTTTNASIINSSQINASNATISNTLTTETINNNGYITSPNANIQTIDTGQNGTITLRSGSNIMDIYSNNGQFYINSGDGNVNLGSAYSGLGGLGLTMDATTKDITIHKILTTATINNSGTITSAILNGDISGNLAAGTNITLITSGGITTIASTPPTLPYLCATLSSNYAPGTGSSYTLIYNTITALNGISYNTGTGIATIPSTGVYSISASVNIDDISINARINTRCRVRVNNNWIQGYPQGYGYARLSTEVPYATAVVSEWMFFFTQNDTIDVRADVGIGTNTNFTSAFTGLQFFNGCSLTIKKID